MVYLPGIDGTGLAASRQFPFLVDAFELHALSIPGSDRTPFEGLIKLIECGPCHVHTSQGLEGPVQTHRFIIT